MLPVNFSVSERPAAICYTWLVVLARFTMFHCAFRSLGRPYSIRTLIAGAIVCGCAVVVARADERPTKPADGSVAKVVAPRQAGASATAEKPSKEHIQQLIQD